MRPGRRSSALGLALTLAAAALWVGCRPASPPSAAPPTGEPTAAAAGAPAAPWFREVSAESGLEFDHRSGHATRFWMPEMLTGGVGILDFDNDGWMDVFLVNGGSLNPPRPQVSGHKLYRNLGGFRFADVTQRAGLGGLGEYGMGCACADVDADGWTDVLITHLRGLVLYRNLGNGTFADVTLAAGLDTTAWATSAAFFDGDGDGALDLFVTHYLRWSPETELNCHSQGGRPDYCSPMNYKAPAMDALFRNLGGGKFTNVTATAGMDRAYGNGLGVACADFNDDGRVDVFVANDAMSNQLWINQGQFKFTDEATIRGCAVSAVGMPRAGMGVAVVDLLQRGGRDLFVTHLVGEGNGLFLNTNGYFADWTAPRSANATSRPMTGFGVGFADFDNDGELDLYVANGRVKFGARDLDPQDPYAEPNSLLRGHGRGEFSEAVPAGGTNPVVLGTSRGAALGDLDNDGGVDVVVVNRDGRAHVLRNQAGRGHWIQFRVQDARGVDAFNARVQLRSGKGTQYREVIPNQSYCSSHDPRVHFGLGATAQVEGVTVRWSDGRVEEFGSLEVDRLHVLRMGMGWAVLGRN